jgi:hypothetical protein
VAGFVPLDLEGLNAQFSSFFLGHGHAAQIFNFLQGDAGQFAEGLLQEWYTNYLSGWGGPSSGC